MGFDGVRRGAADDTWHLVGLAFPRLGDRRLRAVLRSSGRCCEGHHGSSHSESSIMTSSSQPLLEVKGLSVVSDAGAVLSEIGLTLDRDEVLGIVGETGAG